MPQLGMSVPFGQFEELHILPVLAHVQDPKHGKDVVVLWIGLRERQRREWRRCILCSLARWWDRTDGNADWSRRRWGSIAGFCPDDVGGQRRATLRTRSCASGWRIPRSDRHPPRRIRWTSRRREWTCLHVSVSIASTRHNGHWGVAFGTREGGLRWCARRTARFPDSCSLLLRSARSVIALPRPISCSLDDSRAKRTHLEPDWSQRCPWECQWANLRRTEGWPQGWPGRYFVESTGRASWCAKVSAASKRNSCSMGCEIGSESKKSEQRLFTSHHSKLLYGRWRGTKRTNWIDQFTYRCPWLLRRWQWNSTIVEG